MLDEEALAWIALHALGFDARARNAVVARGGAATVFRGGAAAVEDLARATDGPTLEPGAAAAAFATARRVAPFVERGGRVLGAADPSSLGRLADDPRAPLCAFARGDVSLLRAPRTIAIVGARACSARGRQLADDLAGRAAEAGVVVVSGAAIGIDAAAHDAALRNGGRTVAVLGEPLRRDGRDERPARFRRLLRGDAADRALAVTTYGPWAPPQRWWFAARNRRVAAMADHVVVVEGKDGSGTRHTIKAAEDLGRKVWAIAGDHERPLSRAPNGALQEGAGWLDLRDPMKQLFAVAALPPTVDEPPTGLLGLLRAHGGRVSVDEASRRLDAPVSTVLSQALALEIQGRLVREGPDLVSRRR